MQIDTVNISHKFSQFSDYWNPRIVGELNEQQVKLARFKGEFVWHSHEHEDEMFFVIKGSFKMELRDKVLDIAEGEFIIIPKGTEHRPVAPEEVLVMLFEPATTLNTGNAEDSGLSRHKLEKL